MAASKQAVREGSRFAQGKAGRRAVRAAVVALLAAAVAGCGNVQRRIAEIEARHGVVLTVTDGARLQDLLGGSLYLTVDNIGKELAAFPRLATQGRRIHVASTGDLLAAAYPAEFIDALLAGAATQDHPGDDQGDIYILNKNLWGLYVDIWQPGTTMLHDPHLRHELMHAIEIDALREMVLAEPWQAVLDESPEGVHRLRVIDALALEMPGTLRSVSAQGGARAGRHPSLATTRHEAYLDFCARWLAVHFGDVNGDGFLDDADALHLRRRVADFDADGDGRLAYEDAARQTGLRHSMRTGADPLTQVEMTAGLVGYRPGGFASPYGRTSPWEDKAEVLDYAVRKRILPHLFAAPGSLDGVTDASRTGAEARLADLSKHDEVLARKIEIIAVFLASLTHPARRAGAFQTAYGCAMVPFDRVLGREEDPRRVARDRNAAVARQLTTYRREVVEANGTLTVTITDAPAAESGP